MATIAAFTKTTCQGQIVGLVQKGGNSEAR